MYFFLRKCQLLGSRNVVPGPFVPGVAGRKWIRKRLPGPLAETEIASAGPGGPADEPGKGFRVAESAFSGDLRDGLVGLDRV